jgi:hypothetical protein
MSEESQVTVPVRSWVVPSLYVPVAVSCCVPPGIIDWFEGVTESDARIAGPTVRIAEAFIEPEVALMDVAPTPVPVAAPPPVIVAIPVLEEVQLTEFVKSFVLPSVKDPVAVNCCILPLAIEGLLGVITKDTRLAGPTVRLADPVVPLA